MQQYSCCRHVQDMCDAGHILLCNRITRQSLISYTCQTPFYYVEILMIKRDLFVTGNAFEQSKYSYAITGKRLKTTLWVHSPQENGERSTEVEMIAGYAPLDRDHSYNSEW